MADGRGRATFTTRGKRFRGKGLPIAYVPRRTNIQRGRAGRVGPPLPYIVIAQQSAKLANEQQGQFDNIPGLGEQAKQPGPDQELIGLMGEDLHGQIFDSLELINDQINHTYVELDTVNCKLFRIDLTMPPDHPNTWNINFRLPTGYGSVLNRIARVQREPGNTFIISFSNEGDPIDPDIYYGFLTLYVTPVGIMDPHAWYVVRRIGPTKYDKVFNVNNEQAIIREGLGGLILWLVDALQLTKNREFFENYFERLAIAIHNLELARDRIGQIRHSCQTQFTAEEGEWRGAALERVEISETLLADTVQLIVTEHQRLEQVRALTPTCTYAEVEHLNKII